MNIDDYIIMILNPQKKKYTYAPRPHDLVHQKKKCLWSDINILMQLKIFIYVYQYMF